MVNCEGKLSILRGNLIKSGRKWGKIMNIKESEVWPQ